MPDGGETADVSGLGVAACLVLAVLAVLAVVVAVAG